MKKILKSTFLYALILAGGLGIGYIIPRVPEWLKPAYTEGNYAAYYPNAETKVVMYGTKWCAYCKKTREYLTEKNIPFLDIDIEDSVPGAAQFKALGGGSIPKVLIGERQIIGFKPDVLSDAWKIISKK
ncbi:MAG: glutaredoxin family protein [Undibacterium sp.]|nr:glutaredoxin family protein [Undibacterium sp.]